jgi:hypothetical protein
MSKVVSINGYMDALINQQNSLASLGGADKGMEAAALETPFRVHITDFGNNREVSVEIAPDKADAWETVGLKAAGTEIESFVIDAPVARIRVVATVSGDFEEIYLHLVARTLNP